MRAPTPIGLAAVLLAAAAAPACRPDGVTAARDQLGRGGRPPIQLDLPITIDPESVSLAFGQELRFESLTLDPFTFDYSQLLRTAPQSTGLNINYSPPAAALVSDTVRFSTDDGSQVIAATVAQGWAIRTLTNNTSCSGDMSLSFTDSTGAVIASFPTATVAAGAGLVDSVMLDALGFSGFVAADADATVGPCVPLPGESVNTSLSFPPLDLASVQLTNIDEPFVAMYAPLASETRVQGVDTVIVDTGQLVLTVQNRLMLPFTGTITLAGVTRGGAPLFQAVSVPAAAGSPGTATVAVNLAGASIAPADVLATVDGSVQAASATVTAAQIAQAIIVSGGGDITIAAAAGPLDPVVTPELIVDVEEAEIFTPDDVDFGDLDDVIRDAIVDSALALLEIENASNVPVRMLNLVAGVTRLDAAGQPLRAANGDFLFETDGAGAPLVLAVTDPGAAELTVARQSTKTLLLSAAPVLDRFVHLLNDSIPVAFAAAGTAASGDGQPARVVQSDVLRVRIELSIRRLLYQRQLARRGGELP